MSSTALATRPKTGPRNGHDAKGRFVHGNRTSGGKPGRSGRKPMDVVRVCQELVEQHQLIPRLALMAAGEPVLQFRHLSAEGKPVVDVTPVSGADQQGAAKILLAYGWGKPAESLAITGVIEHRFVLRMPARAPTPEQWLKQYHREGTE